MAVTRPQCPFACYVGGHPEEIGLRVLDQLRVVVTEETQKDLLGDVIEVAGIQRPTSTQKLSQWGTPAPEPDKPVRQPFIRCAGMHASLDKVTGPGGPHPGSNWGARTYPSDQSLGPYRAAADEFTSSQEGCSSLKSCGPTTASKA